MSLKAEALQALKDSNSRQRLLAVAKHNLLKKTCADCGHGFLVHDRDGCHGTGKDGLECIGCGGFVKHAGDTLKIK